MIPYIVAAALSAGVPADLLLAVCWTESHHRNVITINDGGSVSYGPCQIKLATARLLNSAVQPSELLTVQGSTKYAALYLRRNLIRYSHNRICAVIAYNRGNAASHCGIYRNLTYPQFDSFVLNSHTEYSRKVLRAQKEKPWLAKRSNYQNPPQTF